MYLNEYTFPDGTVHLSVTLNIMWLNANAVG